MSRAISLHPPLYLQWHVTDEIYSYLYLFLYRLKRIIFNLETNIKVYDTQQGNGITGGGSRRSQFYDGIRYSDGSAY